MHHHLWQQDAIIFTTPHWTCFEDVGQLDAHSFHHQDEGSPLPLARFPTGICITIGALSAVRNTLDTKTEHQNLGTGTGTHRGQALPAFPRTHYMTRTICIFFGFSNLVLINSQPPTLERREIVMLACDETTPERTQHSTDGAAFPIQSACPQWQSS